MGLTNQTIDYRMKILGYYQIIGGLLGVLITIRLLIGQETINGLTLFFILIAGCLYSFSIYCGNLLRKLDLKALVCSKWNQGLQIVEFGLFGIGFRYFSGIYFRFGFNWSEKFIPNIDIGLSSWTLSYLPQNMDVIILYVNIVPLLALLLIFKIERDIKIRKELSEIASEESTIKEG